MDKKIISTILIISLFVIGFSTYSFAATDVMKNVKNTVMNVENTVGDAVVDTKNAIVDGANSVANGAAALGNDTMNTADTTTGVLNNRDSNYTATRTATTNNNLFGLSSTAWTWLILGIIGIVIVGLVWYYGAQYEHRNYNND